MKKFFDKFFRKDLELNKKWWHRLFKVIRIVILVAIAVFLFIWMWPSFDWEIIYKWTIVERLPENWYYWVKKLINWNEYLYITNTISLQKWKYKENKKILEESLWRDPTIFCSNNWTTDYLYKIQNEWNLSLYKNNNDKILITDILSDLGSKCIWIMTSNTWNDSIRVYNSKTKNNENITLVEDWWYIYEIIEPNIVLILILYLLKVLWILLWIIAISFTIYYQWIIYIIYWNKKNKK